MNNRPPYASFDSPAKFTAIQSIIAKRLKEHPEAICSYSGGSDSDIMLHLIEITRELFNLPPVEYEFFNTGLELKATKDHVKDMEKKYGVTIKEIRPRKSIVTVCKQYGIPFISKTISQGLDTWQRKNVPLSIIEEFETAEDKHKKLAELVERYPKSKKAIVFLCSCDKDGNPTNSQTVISSSKYLSDFIRAFPPDFKVSRLCCDYCKKQTAHDNQKDFEMIITGERKAEGGVRSAQDLGCFSEKDGKFRLRPLYYVSDKDKQWYKETYNIRYSDAYEVYGLKRTGCCGCSISYRAVEYLEMIGKYEPNLKKAAWSVFGKSYEYRRKYNEYKAMRREEEKNIKGQMNIFDILEGEQLQWMKK